MQKSDYEIIQEILGGNKDLFSELLSRYKALVFSVVLRMVNNSEEANDLSQEIFIKIYKNLDKYNNEYKFSTWVIRIATNHIIDYRRKKKQDVVSIDELTSEPSFLSTPESEYLKKERKVTLNDALKALPDIYKVPIVLYHQENLSYQEIADITGESLSKIKNRIFRGRKLLKDILIKSKEGEICEL